jgi:hypothetical protein
MFNALSVNSDWLFPNSISIIEVIAQYTYLDSKTLDLFSFGTLHFFLAGLRSGQKISLRPDLMLRFKVSPQ